MRIQGGVLPPLRRAGGGCCLRPVTRPAPRSSRRVLLAAAAAASNSNIPASAPPATSSATSGDSSSSNDASQPQPRRGLFQGTAQQQQQQPTPTPPQPPPQPPELPLPAAAAQALDAAAAACMAVVVMLPIREVREQLGAGEATAAVNALAALMMATKTCGVGFDWMLWKHQRFEACSKGQKWYYSQLRSVLKKAGIVGVNVPGAGTEAEVFLMHTGTGSISSAEAAEVARAWASEQPPWLQQFLQQGKRRQFCMIRSSSSSSSSQHAQQEEAPVVVHMPAEASLKRLRQQQQQALQALLQQLEQLQEEQGVQQLQQRLQKALAGMQGGVPSAAAAAALPEAGSDALQVLAHMLQHDVDPADPAATRAAAALASLMQSAPASSLLMWQHKPHEECSKQEKQRLRTVRSVLASAGIRGMSVRSPSRSARMLEMMYLEGAASVSKCRKALALASNKQQLAVFARQPLDSASNAFCLMLGGSFSGGSGSSSSAAAGEPAEADAAAELPPASEHSSSSSRSSDDAGAGDAASSTGVAAATISSSSADDDTISAGSDSSTGTTSTAAAGSSSSSSVIAWQSQDAGLAAVMATQRREVGTALVTLLEFLAHNNPYLFDRAAWEEGALRACVASAAQQMLAPDCFDFLVWQQDELACQQDRFRQDSPTGKVWAPDAAQAWLQTVGIKSCSIPHPLVPTSCSLLLLYGQRMLQTHTVTAVNSLAAQLARDPSAWLEPLLLQLQPPPRDGRKQTDPQDVGGSSSSARLAFVRMQGASDAAADDDDDAGAAEVVLGREVPAASGSSSQPDTASMISRLQDDLQKALAAAEAAPHVYGMQAEQRQLQEYRRVLERVYQQQAANSTGNSSSGGSGGGSSSSSSSGGGGGGGSDADSSSTNSTNSLTELLLPQLTVSPPEGTAASWDSLAEAWSNWSNESTGGLDFDRILGPGAKPNGVQAWLLPQLLDDAQPPLFLVAPPGTGRLTAVLLAAAAELAAAAAQQQQQDEEEAEEGEQQQRGSTASAAAEVAAAEQQQEEGEWDEEQDEAEQQGSDGDEAAEAFDASVVLPWEEEEAAAAADSSAEAEGESAGDPDAHTAAVTVADADADEAEEAEYEYEDDDDDAVELCSPFLLLMLPSQEAAEAAAAQHGPLLAAAGARHALLPQLPLEAAADLELKLAAAEKKLTQRMEGRYEARDALQSVRSSMAMTRTDLLWRASMYDVSQQFSAWLQQHDVAVEQAEDDDEEEGEGGDEAAADEQEADEQQQQQQQQRGAGTGVDAAAAAGSDGSCSSSSSGGSDDDSDAPTDTGTEEELRALQSQWLRERASLVSCQESLQLQQAFVSEAQARLAELRAEQLALTTRALLAAQTVSAELAHADVLVATPDSLLQYTRLNSSYQEVLQAHSGRGLTARERRSFRVFDFSQLYWFVADEAGMRDGVATVAAARPQEQQQRDAAYLALQQRAFFDRLSDVARQLQRSATLSAPEDEERLTAEDVDMSEAARMVYLAEDVPLCMDPRPSASSGLGFLDAADWRLALQPFSALKQLLPVRMLLIASQPAAAGASAASTASSSSSGGSSKKASKKAAAATAAAAEEPTAVCRLFPADLLTLMGPDSSTDQVVDSVADAVRKAAATRDSASHAYTRALSAVDLIRFSLLAGSSSSGGSSGSSSSGVSSSSSGTSRQQQSQAEVVLPLAREVRSKKGSRSPSQIRDFQSTCNERMALLQTLAAARSPSLCVQSFSSFGKTQQVWVHYAVVYRDASRVQPDYRPDLDPERPCNLSFSFTDPARQLLMQQLPQLARQQQELLALAAGQQQQQPTPPVTGGADAGSSSSSKSGGGTAIGGAVDSTTPMQTQWQAPRAMGAGARRELAGHLKAQRRRLACDARYAELQQQRGQLPAAASKAQLLQLLEQRQVVIVTGDTGCGKSTQVPQFIMEAAEESSSLDSVRIFAAQPRRLITTALASRVAQERGEAVGRVVGYSIHNMRASSRITRLTFCTTGILIRRLMIDPQLASITHVIIDEVHERGLEVDFLLTAMRQLVAARPDLKLLLMSATVDTQKLVDYFGEAAAGSVGALHIEGNTFPVDQFYLEDLIEARLCASVAKHQRRQQGLATAEEEQEWQEYEEKEVGQKAAGSDGDEAEGLEEGGAGSSSDSSSSSTAGLPPPLPSAEEVAAVAEAAGRLRYMPRNAEVATVRRPEAQGLYSRRLESVLGYQVNESELRAAGYSDLTVQELQFWLSGVTQSNVAMTRKQHTKAAVAAIQFVVQHEPNPGAVLVFLPSWVSIVEVYDGLADYPSFDRLILHVLHSMLPINEQQEVFEHAPPGFRKVILATNIAESSITFDDVTVVINSCRVNVASFDPINSMPQLGPQWASKASLWQRRGRAGRVQRGMVIHLVPRAMAEQHLEAYDLPEMRRVPLVDVCLLVKSLGIEDIAGFLAAAPDPPQPQAVSRAVKELQELGALSTQTQELTALGRLLALLPGDIKATRLVIFGALLGVLDPVLTLAAAGGNDGTRYPVSMPGANDNASSSSDATSSSGEGSSSGAGRPLSRSRLGGGGISDSQQAFDFNAANKLREARRFELAGDSVSDHAVTLAAFQEYLEVTSRDARARSLYGSNRGKPAWKSLQQRMLSERDLKAIHAERLQYTQLLYRAGFLAPSHEFLEARRMRHERQQERLARGAAAYAAEAEATAARQAAALQSGAAGAGAAGGPEGYLWYDLLLDDELAELDPEAQAALRELQAAQGGDQPAVTAMDWVLGEYADAAAGSHSFLTLDDEGGYMSETGGGGRGSWGDDADDSYGSSSSSRDRREALEPFEYLPQQLSSRDLKGLIADYSSNLDQHPLLLEAALAAGLYPNFAFADVNASAEKLLEKLPKAAGGGVLAAAAASDDSHDKELCGGEAAFVRWRGAEDGRCFAHISSLLAKRVPRFRWTTFSSKRLNTETNKVSMLSCSPVPDLAVLLFSTGFDPALPATPPPLPQQLGQGQQGSASEGGRGSTAADNAPAEEEEDERAGDPSSSSSSSSGSGEAARVELLGGFAGYKFEQPDDLAALVWTRQHLQLLLELAVAGQSAAIVQQSRSFSSFLGQLLEMSVFDVAAAASAPARAPAAREAHQTDNDATGPTASGSSDSPNGQQDGAASGPPANSLTQLYVWQQAALQRQRAKEQERLEAERVAALDRQLEEMSQGSSSEGYASSSSGSGDRAPTRVGTWAERRGGYESGSGGRGGRGGGRGGG